MLARFECVCMEYIGYLTFQCMLYACVYSNIILRHATDDE